MQGTRVQIQVGHISTEVAQWVSGVKFISFSIPQSHPLFPGKDQDKYTETLILEPDYTCLHLSAVDTVG